MISKTKGGTPEENQDVAMLLKLSFKAQADWAKYPKTN